MSRGAAGGLSRAGGRRDRLRRERTAGQLRRQARLEAEAQEQLGPTLGPAGRPMGEAAMALWRRRQADAYLALPPWRRAWRTWASWGRVHRAAVVLAGASHWAGLLRWARSRLVEDGFISLADLDLIRLSDDPEEIVELALRPTEP